MIICTSSFIYLILFISSIIPNVSFANKINKINIGPLYSVMDCSNGNLIFVMESGRVFVKNGRRAIEKIHEFSELDKVVDLYKINDQKFLLLIERLYDKKLTLRHIEISNSCKLKLNWDLDILFYKKIMARKIMNIEGKLYLFLENSFIVINELNGTILENESFTLEEEKSIILMKFNTSNKPSLFLTFDHREKSLVFYGLDVVNNIVKFQLSKIIKLEKNVKIFVNSGIFYEKDGTSIFKLLFVRSDSLNFGLLEYILETNKINYLDLNLNVSFLSEELQLKMATGLTLRKLDSKELIITFSNYGDNISQNFFHIFEYSPNLITNSFIPIINKIQSSSIHIFKNKLNNFTYKHLLIIHYNDLNNYLNFTIIFDYRKSLEKSQMYRYTLKLEYKRNGIKINHGPIIYSAFTKNEELIIQWEDSTTMFIFLNCNIPEKKCEKPKISEIYESLILSGLNPNYYKNNFLFFISPENKEISNGNLFSNFKTSEFIHANNLYYDSYNDSSDNLYFSVKSSNEFEKINGTIMLTINNNNSIFGYLIEEDEIIWRNDILKQFLSENRTYEEKKIKQFIIEDATSPKLVIIINDVFVFKIDIYTGENILNKLKIPDSKEVIVIAKSKKIGKSLLDPKLILLDENNHVLKILDLNDLNLNEVKSIKDEMKYCVINNNNNIRCFKVDFKMNSSLEWEYTFHNEQIIIYATPTCPNCTNFPVLLSEEYEIINKFNYSNILVVITNKHRIMFFNSINGNLIYSSIFPETFRPPFTLQIDQNIVIITSHHTLHKVPVIMIFELYQFFDNNIESKKFDILKKLKFLISPQKNVKESRIFADKFVTVQKSIFLYKYELPITSLAVSNTLESITPKFILFGNEHSNVIEGFSENFLQKHISNQEYKSRVITKNLSINKSDIPERIKFPVKFSNVKKILTLPHNRFESTSLYILLGPEYIEINKFYPNSSFDTLPDDFNKINVLVTTIALVTITTIAILLSKKKTI